MFLKGAPIPYCKVQQGQFGLEKFMKKNQVIRITNTILLLNHMKLQLLDFFFLFGPQK